MEFLMVMYNVMLCVLVASVSGSNALKAMGVVPDTLLVYFIVAMRAAPFKNENSPVWALMLASFRSSVNFKSKYDILVLRWQTSLKLWGTGLLSLRHGSKSSHTPFWLFWDVMVIKNLYRISARSLASNSLLHRRSSELVHEYVGSSNVIGYSEFNPETMHGCLQCINDSRSVIALVEKIWQQYAE
jgi:hypothetical protein